MRIRYAARTDVGMVRAHNEDYFALIEDEIAKIDLLTQRDSPEEHLKARCISPRVTRFKPVGTYPRFSRVPLF